MVSKKFLLNIKDRNWAIEEQKRDIKKTNSKKADINPTISILTLNMN